MLNVLSEIIKDNDYSYNDIVYNLEKKNIIYKKTQNIYFELAEIRKLMKEYSISNDIQLLKDVILKHQIINNNIKIVRSIKYPINEVVNEDGVNILKQYPYSFDEFLNPNLDLLKVNNFST